MNIIQAIQKAENGALISNNFKLSRRFLKYTSNGTFRQYSIIDGKAVFDGKVELFPMGDILSIAWEVLDFDPFEN